MLSTGILAIFGFIFWIICTKIFTTDQVGLATVLISAITLISNFSLLGLNIGLVKYLPKSKVKNNKINTAFLLVVITSIIISIIYLLGIEYFANQMTFIKNNLFLSIFFILISVLASINTLTDSIFIAYREAKYILIKNSIVSVLRIVLPFLFIFLGAIGIFISATSTYFIAVMIALYVFFKKYQYKLLFTFHKESFIKMYRFSFGNYIASFISNLPLNILPLIIINRLGAKDAAYFYLDMMILGIINIVQISLNQSLFSEGSNNEKKLSVHIKKTIVFIFLILIPLVLFILLFGKYILLAFGKNYSSEGIILLNYLCISVIFTAINGLLSAYLNIKNKVNIIISMCILGTIITLALTYYFIQYGLQGVGIGWLISQIVICSIYIIIVQRIKK